MKDSRDAKHVLIVDDEAAIAYVFQRYFEIHGFRVSVASNGNAALALAESERIDALVTDFRMPGLNGRELAQRLRQRLPGLPVVIVSAYGTEIRNDVPGMRIMSKPVDPAALIACVNDMIADAGTAQRLRDAED